MKDISLSLSGINSDFELSEILSGNDSFILESYDSIDVIKALYPCLGKFSNYKIILLPESSELTIQKDKSSNYSTEIANLNRHGKLSNKQYAEICKIISGFENILYCDDEINADFLTINHFKKQYILNKAEDALSYIDKYADYLNLAIIDIQFVNQHYNGFDLLNKIKGLNPSIKVVMLSGYDDILTAFKVFMLDGDYFISKDNFNTEHFKAILSFIRNDELCLITGKSPAMTDLYKKISFYARLKNDVLLLGENGTGKELVAKAIYLFGNKEIKSNFIPYNCAGIPDSLFEGEIFGYEKGAFTGAVNEKKSPFILAGKGVVFLDEIGDMSLYQQAKLLRLIQEKKLTPLGSKDLQAYDIKCRIIYATNKDLVNEMDNNNFRTDLYFRISDSIIEIPPLRHRKEDIDLLIASFMAKFIKKNNIKDPDYIKQLNEIEIDENSLTQLKNYDFPGNIRELEKIVYQSIIDYLMNNLKKLSFKTQKPQPNTLNVEKNMKVYSVELILNLIKNNIIKADSLNDEVKYDIVKQLEYQNYKRENIADLLKIKKASLNNFISNYQKSNA